MMAIDLLQRLETEEQLFHATGGAKTILTEAIQEIRRLQETEAKYLKLCRVHGTLEHVAADLQVEIGELERKAQ
jgi:hypothetical protein